MVMELGRRLTPVEKMQANFSPSQEYYEVLYAPINVKPAGGEGGEGRA